MRNKIFNILFLTIRFILDSFYHKPRYTIKLCFQKKLWKHISYYPEKKSKKHIRIFYEQLFQIWKYGTPNEFYFMYGLDVKYKKEFHSYVHYKPFMKRRDELNLQSLHNSTCILRNKFYFGLFADSIGIKTPKNIAYIQNNKVFLIDLKSHITIDEFIKSYNYSLFCKTLDGECGNGIFKLNIYNGVIHYNNEYITLEEFKNRIAGTTYLFQEPISQHEKMSQMYDKAINSLRLVTIRSLKDGEIKVIPSILRIGTNGSYVDNTSQGGIAVGFNLKNGQLNKYGFYKPQYGLKTTEHPNSHIIFETFHIPYIHQAIEQAKLFHSMLNDIHSIGWDIAISKNGPIFIEGNDNWEINGPQVGNHGLKKEFKEYFYK